MLRTIAMALDTSVDELLRPTPRPTRRPRDRRRAGPAQPRVPGARPRAFRVGKGTATRRCRRSSPCITRSTGCTANGRRPPRRPAGPTPSCAPRCAPATTTSRAGGEGRRAARRRRPHGRPAVAAAGRRHRHHLGFTLHYVGDLPHSTRSVTDNATAASTCPCSSRRPRLALAMLQALASHVLGNQEPRNYADFLRQRVETNYLTAAILLPEQAAVRFLTAAKNMRRISVEDLRDAFAVSYETAAHRFTNLATARLDIPVHFMKVHESGTISRPTRTTRVPSRPMRSARSRARSCAATGRPAPCSTSRTASARSTSTPTPRRAPSGAPRDREGQGGRVLGERRRAVRAREVVPRARDPAPCGVALPRRVLLPPGPGALAERGRMPRGRPRARPRACSPRCRPAPSPASTRPRCTSSSRRTRPAESVRTRVARTAPR